MSIEIGTSLWDKVTIILQVVTAVFSWVAVLVAILAVRHTYHFAKDEHEREMLFHNEEHKREMLFNRAELFNTLRAEYISDAMQRKRHAASQVLLSNFKNPNSPRDRSWLQEGQPVFDVLDFWEMVGLFLRRDALDKEVIWHIMSRDICLYWDSAQEYIDYWQAKNQTVYENLDFLVRKVLELDREHNCESPNPPSTNQLIDALEREAAVTLDMKPESAQSVDGLLANEPSNGIVVPQRRNGSKRQTLRARWRGYVSSWR